MQIRRFTVGMFQVNTYLVTDPATGKSAIVDTGETQELAQALAKLQPPADIELILLTHGHVDHAGSLLWLQERFPNATTYLPAKELPLFQALPQQGDWFGMPSLNRPCGRIDRYVEDGDEISLGNTRLKFLSTPGHTPGQGCYYDDADIIVGDTLFKGGVGRVDFPMSNPALAKESLRRLMKLPGHLRVHSGHGEVTTLADELATNPFLGFLRS